MRARTITDEMALAAANELARFAEERGIHEDDIVPRMNEWEVFPRVAVATAVKAQDLGLARIVKSAEQLREQATRSIRAARDSTRPSYECRAYSTNARSFGQVNNRMTTASLPQLIEGSRLSLNLSRIRDVTCSHHSVSHGFFRGG